MSCHIDIFQRCLSLGIFDIDIFCFANIIELEIFPKQFITTVSGSIIDYNCEIIRIVLTENGIEVILQSKFGIVIITWNY
jgi:hypothetical protein